MLGVFTHIFEAIMFPLTFLFRIKNGLFQEAGGLCKPEATERALAL